MARAIWKGIISFGLVSIPVKLYSATENHDIHFNQVHEVCKSRIREQRYCPVCDRKVEYEELQKGYEFSKGEYVILEKEDFEKLPLPARHSVSVQAFVEQAEIDPIYHDKTYYLEPDEAAVRPYALFLRALKDKGLVAIGTIALRNKESLCNIRPYGEALVLDMLLYPDEIRIKPEDTELPSVKLHKNEVDMAKHLVDLMTQSFEPDEFEDNYKVALKKLIEAKMEGHQIAVPATPKARVVDLMEALRASVKTARSGKVPAADLEEDEEDSGEAEVVAAEKVDTEDKPRRRRTAAKRATSGTASRATAKRKTASRRKKPA